jgi:integrase
VKFFESARHLAHALRGWVDSRQPADAPSSLPAEEKNGVQLGDLDLIRGWELAKAVAGASGNWRGNTPLTYRYCLHNWIAHGIQTFADVNRESISRFVTERLTVDEVAPITVNGDLSAMLAVLDQLERHHGYDVDELVVIIKRRWIKKGKKLKFSAPSLEPEEVERLCLKAREIEPRAELAIRVCVLSGVRVGELARMRREDFDLEGNTIPVGRPRGPIVRIYLDETLGRDGYAKTGARVTPVCDELAALIRTHAPSSGFIFLPGTAKNYRGIKTWRGWLAVDSFERDMKKVREAVGPLGNGRPTPTWNVLRHTRATWWWRAGVDKDKIACWLGNTRGVLEDHYLDKLEYDPDVNKSHGSISPPPAPVARDERPTSPVVANVVVDSPTARWHAAKTAHERATVRALHEGRTPPPPLLIPTRS